MAEFGIGYVARMTERKTEVHVLLRRVVQLAVRLVVAEPVAPVVGEPQFARFGMPVEAD